MDPVAIDELASQLVRLRIGQGADDQRAMFGDPPWLYPIDVVLRVARTLPDSAGPDAPWRRRAARLRPARPGELTPSPAASTVLPVP